MENFLQNPNSYTGIILAGGKGKRIKKNLNEFDVKRKPFLKINNKPIIEIVFSKLQPIFEEIIIVTSIECMSFIEELFKCQHLGVRLVNDILPGKGSLGGIYTGLVSSNNRYNFIVACDMPFINTELVRYLLKEVDDYDVVVPRLNDCSLPNKGFETLHAVYSKTCIRYIEEQLRNDNLKIVDFFSMVRVKEISEDILRKFDPKLFSFFNINTDDDYKLALDIAKSLTLT